MNNAKIEIEKFQAKKIKVLGSVPDAQRENVFVKVENGAEPAVPNDRT